MYAPTTHQHSLTNPHLHVIVLLQNKNHFVIYAFILTYYYVRFMISLCFLIVFCLSFLLLFLSDTFLATMHTYSSPPHQPPHPPQKNEHHSPTQCRSNAILRKTSSTPCTTRVMSSIGPLIGQASGSQTASSGTERALNPPQYPAVPKVRPVRPYPDQT